MARIENWPHALADFIEERRATPFEWGRQDCCIFVADWVTRLTGKDPAAEWRGQYKTEHGAALIINRNGGIMAFADAVFGNACDVKLARRGDVVCVDTPTGLALGVCAGRDVFAPGASGLVVIPTLESLGAWRID